MLWLELSVVVIRKFPISSPDWTHDGDNSHENRKSQLRQGARLLFSLNGHVYLQLNNFHFAREQWSQSMPGQTRWILASLLLLSGTLPAAEHPTFKCVRKRLLSPEHQHSPGNLSGQISQRQLAENRIRVSRRRR